MEARIVTKEEAIRLNHVQATGPYVKSEAVMLERAVATYGVENCLLVPTGKGYSIWRPANLIKQGE